MQCFIITILWKYEANRFTNKDFTAILMQESFVQRNNIFEMTSMRKYLNFLKHSS